MGLRRRLENVEGRIGARASPGGRPPWRTPEEQVSRERQFRQLYLRLQPPGPPLPEDPEEVRAELYATIERRREATERKEQRT